MADIGVFDLMTTCSIYHLGDSCHAQCVHAFTGSIGTKGTAMLTTTCPDCVVSCETLMDGSAVEISQHLTVLGEHKA